MPELIINKQKCLNNIEKMAGRARENHLSFRPHFKTHQSAEIGNWYRDFGVSKITVSSFRMASYFAKAGWTDILVAFPFDPGQLPTLGNLTAKARISILLDNLETIPHLAQINSEVSFYIDIDTGYGRTGVSSDAKEAIADIIQESGTNRHLSFSGFYCHAGHSYKTADPDKKMQIHARAISELKELKDQFKAYAPMALYGDTPNCSTQSDFTGIDEITPGNFVFYDLTQLYLGSCKREEIAVTMACPVVGKYPSDKRLVIHGGGVHFSKETMQVNGKQVYGQLVNPGKNGWIPCVPDQFIDSMSQEHGILEHCGEWMDRVSMGATLHFLPVHSCLTANLMREYKTTDGERISTLNSQDPDSRQL